MRSPLDITYDEVVENPLICKENPLCKTRSLTGELVIWEGRKDHKNIRSQVFRVVLDRYDRVKYYKFDKRYNEWVPVRRLEPNKMFFRKQEKVPAGVVRIEVFSNGRVKRTVGK